MDRFQSLSVFIKVAEVGGFAKAAEALAMSPPAVTRAISNLEDHLGIKLFIRTTRSMRLTDSGKHFLEDSKKILAHLLEAENAARGSFSEPAGHISITAPVMFGRLYITPFLKVFLEKYPAVQIRANFVDRLVDLMEDGIDVALRIGELSSSSMMGARVGAVRRVYVSSPAYLKSRSIPLHPGELIDHDIIHPSSFGGEGEWPFQFQSKHKRIHLKPRLAMNSLDAIIDMLKTGSGISSLLSYQVAREVEQGTLSLILQDYELPELPLHILHQEGRQVSGRVRLFVDELAAYLKKDPRLKV